jgi:hypothetical protein
MRSFIKIAEKLDAAGLYKLSDKLLKIAQTSDYDNLIFYEPGPGFRKDKYNLIDRNNYDVPNNSQILNSSNPNEFTQKLFEFGRMNNMFNLTQAFDEYANAGAKFNGQYINTNPMLKELYLRVKDTNEMITPDMFKETLDYLSSSKNDTYLRNYNSSKSNSYNNKFLPGSLPGLSDKPLNPADFSSYQAYLDATGKKRAPIGTNNDNERRDPNYLSRQEEYISDWKDSINVYTNSNDLSQLMLHKRDIMSDINLTPQSKKTILEYLNTKAKEIK